MPRQRLVREEPEDLSREDSLDVLKAVLDSDPTATLTLTITDERLNALRPDPSIVDQYVPRMMPNGQTDIEYLMDKWRAGKDNPLGAENILLVGDTQGGKTMLVNVLAVLAGMESIGMPLPVFTLSASSGITDFDLFGQPTAWTDEQGVEHIVWLPGIVDMAARIGGILYLDEVNMMPERVTSSLHPLCDWRRAFVNRAKAIKVPGDGFMAETVKASPDLWILGTMNPNYRGAGQVNEAFGNRFRWLKWDYDESVERKLIPNEGVRQLGEALRSARATGHLRTPIGTAALMRLAADVAEVGVDMAIYCLLSMFTEDEAAQIEVIIRDRSYRTLLVAMPTAVPAGWNPDTDSPY